MSAARDGVQIGWAWKSVNRAPSSAIRSTFGVSMYGEPKQPRSPYPWSSVNTTSTFGRSAPAMPAPRHGGA
jgi:hypothetical protein